MSASAVSKPIFDINANEENTKITTPMLSGSDKKHISFCSHVASASLKSSGGGDFKFLS